MGETITHIVCFKYKPDITWAKFEAHFEQFMDLKTRCISPKTGKPLIKSMKAGKCNKALLLYSNIDLCVDFREESILGIIQQGNDSRICPRI